MWNVKRMNTARKVGLSTAPLAGGVAASGARGSGHALPLVAIPAIGLCRPAPPEDLQRQTRPPASADGAFVRLDIPRTETAQP